MSGFVVGEDSTGDDRQAVQGGAVGQGDDFRNGKNLGFGRLQNAGVKRDEREWKPQPVGKWGDKGPMIGLPAHGLLGVRSGSPGKRSHFGTATTIPRPAASSQTSQGSEGGPGHAKGARPSGNDTHMEAGEFPLIRCLRQGKRDHVLAETVVRNGKGA